MPRMKKEKKKETLLACQHEDQLKFEKQELEQKAEFEKEKVASPSKQNVKLLKLVIMKYNEALENWLATRLSEGASGAKNEKGDRWPSLYIRRLRACKKYSSNKLPPDKRDH